MGQIVYHWPIGYKLAQFIYNDRAGVTRIRNTQREHGGVTRILYVEWLVDWLID